MKYFVWTPEKEGREDTIEIVADNQSAIADVHADLIERAIEASIGSPIFPEPVTKEELQELMSADPKEIPYRLLDPIFNDDERIVDSEHGLGVGFWLGAFVGIKSYKINEDSAIAEVLDMDPDLARVADSEGLTHFGFQRKFDADKLSGIKLDETRHLSIGKLDDEGRYIPVATVLTETL